MARLKIHVIGLLVDMLGMLAWFVALGGLSASMVQCVQGPNDYEFCSKTYMWEWWSLWLEFFLLFALFISGFLESYNRGRMVFLAYFTIASILTMGSAHHFIMDMDITSLRVDISELTSEHAANTAAAGFMMVSVVNFALLIVLGIDFAYTPPSTATAIAALQKQPTKGLRPQGAGGSSAV